MSFTFAAEHDEFRTVVASFLDRRSTEQDVRRLMATDEGYDPDVWQQMADQLGLQGLLVPERFGGSEQTLLELVVVMEQMGRSLLCSPYLSSAVLATLALLGSQDEQAMGTWLPSLASGRTIGTLAVTADGSFDEQRVGVTAQLVEPSGWALSGTAGFVTDGVTADLLLVLARGRNGLSLFAVNGPAPGLTRTPMRVLDETRKLATLTFDSTPATLLGGVGGGGRTLQWVLDRAAVALAAEQLGGAQRALEMAVDYACTRYQFGRPIGSFQAIKHKCADVLLGVESARSAVLHAAWVSVHRPEQLSELASLAQAHCSDVYFQAAAESVQVHGGIGFTWEHPAHLYFKRAKASEVLLGDPAFHRERLAQCIGL